MSPQPDGMVDPTAPTEVATVLDAVLATMGAGGVVDLLRRLPGVRFEPGSPRRLLAAAVAPTVWVGAEDLWTFGEGRTPIEHAQSVSGVVLHRAVVPPGRLGATLAPQLVRLAGDQGSQQETSVVLSGARDAAR